VVRADPEEIHVPVTRLNHAVLYVRDVDRSVAFYSSVLGFRTVLAFPGAAFLQAEASNNDHDLGLFQMGDQAAPSPAGRTSVGLYHLAWEVETLTELSRVQDTLLEVGALAGATDHATTKALYAHDPDGLEFEVSWLVPAALIDDATIAAKATNRPLDIAREIERYGPDTRSGIGVSIPIGVAP
jgi:catechol-2,3-dioxygenase